MELYIDLSCLLLFIEAVTIITSIKIITHTKYNKFLLYIFIIMHILFINLLYLSSGFAYLIFLAFNAIFIYMMCENNKFINIVLYFAFYYGFAFILTSLNGGIIYRNSLILINEKQGILLSLLIPLFGLFMIISSKVVDKSFHLYNYKTQLYITIGEEEKLYSCYFDTGNTLKYKDVPVIFINSNNIEINQKIFNKTISIETISGEDTIYISEGLVRKKGDDENHFVYIGLSRSNSFEGCDVLLNAYLF